MLKTIAVRPLMFRLTLFVAALFGVSFFLPQPPAGAAPDAVEDLWIEPMHVSTNSPNGAFAPVTDIAPDGTLMVMYNNERPDPSEPSKQIYTPHFSRSPDGGRTWVVGKAYEGSESAAHLDFVLDGNSQAHVVWRTANGLYYASESEWPVTSGHEIVSSEGRRIDNPAIAVQGDTIFVVWLHANASNVQNVFYSYSRDGGQGWHPAQPLTTDAAAAPDVVFDANGDVHVIWEESSSVFPDPSVLYEIQHLKGTRTTPGTYQWGAETNLSQGHAADASESRQPSIVRDGDVLHVVFEEREEVSGGGSDDANAQISPYHMSFTPGSGWQTPERIIGNNNAFFVNTRLPFYLGTALTACDGAVYVYFHGAETVNSTELIWGTDNGAGSWSDPETVTTPTIRHTNPSVACNSGLVSLSFERIISSVTNHQIYYSNNTGGGVLLPIILR